MSIFTTLICEASESAPKLSEIFKNIWTSTGFTVWDAADPWGSFFSKLVMMGIACFLIYLAVVKKYEPMLLLGIAFGALLVNIPGAYEILFADPVYEPLVDGGIKTISVGGLFHYLKFGVEWVLFPPIIFLGIGAMTDFGPLIANPKSLFLGAAAQIGIFLTLIFALILGFDGAEAAAIGIIGGADGPTAIYLSAKLIPEQGEMMAAIAIAAYSYMALVPVIQPPIMKALTTPEERRVKMDALRTVSKKERIMFPIICTAVVGIVLPTALPLLGMLMLGNLFRESGVVPRLVKTSENELINIVTIFLGIVVGTKAYGPVFLTFDTIKIVLLGVVAFSIATAGGVLLGKLMYKLTGGKVNPLIGAAGVSAVPMAARVANDVGRREDPSNFLLMNAMGPNVAGVIGSAVAAGVLLAIFG